MIGTLQAIGYIAVVVAVLGQWFAQAPTSIVAAGAVLAWGVRGIWKALEI